MKIRNTILVCISLLLLFSTGVFAQQFPGENWLSYNDPLEAGFSPEKLEEAKQFFNSINGGAALVVYKGAVVVSWGENTRRFLIASIRKSLLSALIGNAIEDKLLSLDATLSELDINDKTSLTEKERSAKVKDLMTTSSGIYLPSAFEDRGWKKNKPERGSHDPGTFWYYNNWDFNIMGTIYEKVTGKKIFDAFEKEIAGVIGMQDYREFDGVYFYEPETEHPAYLFKMSSRDLARFGLLYLNNGNWNGETVIPEQWVSLSTQEHVNNGIDGYGYLWWTTPVDGHQVYAAKGAGAQGVYIIPDMELVVVLRADNFTGKPISNKDRETFIEKIIAAHDQKASTDPVLHPMEWFETDIPVSDGSLPGDLPFLGEYIHPQYGKFTIDLNDSKLVIQAKPARFNAIFIQNNEYFIEDFNVNAKFVKTDEKNQKGKCELTPDPETGKLIFLLYY